MPLVNIWRLGHCFHMNHVNFLNRYKLLHADTWPHYQQGNVIDGITTIIRALPLPAAEFMIGITKVFIRSPRTVIKIKKKLYFIFSSSTKSYKKTISIFRYMKWKNSGDVDYKTWLF